MTAPLLLALAGCQSLPELDWNPLIRIEHTTDGAVEIEALGPLVDVRSGPDGLSHAVRPIYQHKANFGLPVTDFLAPFGRRFVTQGGSRWRFWPLIWSGETRKVAGGTEWDGVFFPILFAGNGPEDGDGYFAVFPLAGRMRGLFGIDTFEFFVWPLFMRTRMDVTEPSTSYTVLLLGGWTTGGPRDGSWRILPLYRRRLVRSPEGELRTDQHTVLWPFFTWGLDRGDSDDPGYRTAFWPLYGYESGESWYRSTYLWPFFRVNKETDPSPAEGGDFLYDLPWPLFRWSRTRDKSVFYVFPVYARMLTPDSETTSWFLLFPPNIFASPIALGVDRKSEGRTSQFGHPPIEYKRTDRFWVPFWNDSTRTVEGREGADRHWHLWPFYRTAHEVEGRQESAFFSLMPLLALPFPHPNSDFWKPVDELYSFAWTLWRHQSDGVRHETRFAFDTIMYRTSPRGVRISIPFLYSRRPEGDGVHRHNVLWGLFGWRWDAEGLGAISSLGFDLWTR